MGDKRSAGFYVLTAIFIAFLVFLYGPVITIGILSFQGPTGGLTFPMRGSSMHWFQELFRTQMVGDIWGSFQRSIILGMTVMVITVVFSVGAGMAYRKKILWLDTAFLPYHCKLSHSINSGVFRRWPNIFSAGMGSALVHFRIGCSINMDAAIWDFNHVCSI